MNYIIHPIIFYLASVSSDLKQILFIISTILGITIVCLTFYTFISQEFTVHTQEKSHKGIKRLSIAAIVIVTLSILLPSKEASQEMLISYVITEENLNTTTNELKGTIDYVIDKINGISESSSTED